jgi:uncharacterized DUF497 family protein
VDFQWEVAKANHLASGVRFDEAATQFGELLAISFTDIDHSVGERRLVTLGQRERSGRVMRRIDVLKTGDLRITSAKDEILSAVRSQHLAEVQRGRNLVPLQPDEACAFPTSTAVTAAGRVQLDSVNGAGSTDLKLFILNSARPS